MRTVADVQVRSDRMWDRFKQFHYWAGPFVLFETGELALFSPSPKPDHRGAIMYRSSLGVSLHLSSDSDMPDMYTPEGVPVSRASINRKNSQYLLVDHITSRVVSCGWGYKRSRKPELQWPVHVRGGSVYIPSAGSYPRSREPIAYGPQLALTPDENKWVETLKAGAVNIAALSDTVVPNPTVGRHWSANELREVMEIYGTPGRLLQDSTPKDVAAMAHLPLMRRFEEFESQYLIIK
jgi:hypothetical protein